jgi:hypothetical protein
LGRRGLTNPAAAVSEFSRLEKATDLSFYLSIKYPVLTAFRLVSSLDGLRQTRLNLSFAEALLLMWQSIALFRTIFVPNVLVQVAHVNVELRVPHKSAAWPRKNAELLQFVGTPNKEFQPERRNGLYNQEAGKPAWCKTGESCENV